MHNATVKPCLESQSPRACWVHQQHSILTVRMMYLLHSMKEYLHVHDGRSCAQHQFAARMPADLSSLLLSACLVWLAVPPAAAAASQQHALAWPLHHEHFPSTQAGCLLCKNQHKCSLDWLYDCVVLLFFHCTLPVDGVTSL